MTDIGESNTIKSEFFIGTNANDVVPIEHTTMATEEPSVPNTHKDYRMLIGASGAGSVSALTLNDTATATTVAAVATATATPSTGTNAELTASTNTTTLANVTATMDSNIVAKNNLNSAAEMKGPINTTNNNNLNINPIVNNIAANNHNNNNNTSTNKNNISGANNGAKGKRRRRKSSKQMNNSKPYKKSNWKFQVPRSRDGRRVSTLVPYNTNKFLMEEHMPEYEAAGGRYRDSSFSIDSDENFDEEEFLTKEFSSVYETARAERLEEMNKQQLIQEYLQMESNYDKLCNSIKVRSKIVSNDYQQQIENQNQIKKLENHIKELTAENLDLRRQMADIRSREHHSPPHGRHRHHSNSCSSKRHAHHTTMVNGEPAIGISSEDSESDSTSSSSSSSSSNGSKSSSDCRSKLKRSRSRSSCSSKSSLSEPNHMSGISDDEEAMHLLNGCDSNGTNTAPVF